MKKHSIKFSILVFLLGSLNAKAEPSNLYRAKISEPAFYLGADYLYWKTLESQTDFAVISPGSTPFFPTMASGNLRYPSFDIQSGVRAEGGVRFAPDYWEIIGRYTYLSPSGSIVVPVDDAGNVFATYPTANLTDVTAASAEIDMTYQVADLALGKTWAFANHLFAKALIGPTGLFATQDVDFIYIGSSLSNTIVGREDFRFSGIGLRVGLDLDWHFHYGFGLKAKASFAPIFGNYRHKMESILAVNATTTTTIEWAKFHQQRMITHAQMLLGPSWGRQWKNVGMLLFVGWELNHLWNLQETYRGLLTTAGSNAYATFFTEGLVGFQGLTASFNVNF